MSQTLIQCKVMCGDHYLIGKKLEIFLFMGVQNKYCAVCNKAGNDTPPDHTCYLNWKGSSSSMEGSRYNSGGIQKIY